MTRNEQVIWAAGFLDGESYIGLSRGLSKSTGRPFHQAIIDAAQIRRAPLDVLANLFGGNVREGTRAYYWRVSGRHTQTALRETLPYFVMKRRQAELVLEFCDTMSGKQGKRLSDVLLAERELMWAELRVLNQINVYGQAERLSERAPKGAVLTAARNLRMVR